VYQSGDVMAAAGGTPPNDTANIARYRFGIP
jgi:hypothetical protein